MQRQWVTCVGSTAQRPLQASSGRRPWVLEEGARKARMWFLFSALEDKKVSD